jgi:hypothetical protein
MAEPNAAPTKVETFLEQAERIRKHAESAESRLLASETQAVAWPDQRPHLQQAVTATVQLWVKALLGVRRPISFTPLQQAIDRLGPIQQLRLSRSRDFDHYLQRLRNKVARLRHQLEQWQKIAETLDITVAEARNPSWWQRLRIWGYHFGLTGLRFYIACGLLSLVGLIPILFLLMLCFIFFVSLLA